MFNNSKEVNPDSLLIPKINTVEHYNKEANVRRFSFKKNKLLKIVLTCFLILFFVTVIIGLLVFRIYNKAILVKDSAYEVKAAIAENDLDKVKSQIVSTKNNTLNLKSAYKSISFLKYVPYLGSYIRDGEHVINAGIYGLDSGELIIDTAVPYADLLGFKKGTDQAGSGIETTQDRINFVIKTLPELATKADTISEKVSKVAAEIDEINPDRYPEEFMGKPLRAKIKELVEMIDLGSSFLAKGKPLLESSTKILGVDREMRYLVIFQNDKELRPTGGFITAYSLAKVKSGKFEPVSSSDIYSLDDKYKPKIKAPEPIVKYLKGPYTLTPNLRLRDMNWSPDFKESMDLFSGEIEDLGIGDIDGIIAVDTQLLVNLLNVIGPIGVSGFGNFSTEITPECNCPQVIHELESFADVEGPVVWSQDEPGKIIFAPKNYDNRKKIIGPLMNSILANALGQPKDKLAALFQAGIKSLMEKHVLFYFFDDASQKAVQEFGIAGTIDNKNTDYLHINDANLGGRKSNLYVQEEVLQEVKINKDKSVEKTVTISYKNPAPYDGWLNSVLPNWVRIYVPKGSILTDFTGIDGNAQTYDELGKTVFAGYFELRPLGVAKLTLKYKLPEKAGSDYRLFIQKQPGKNRPLYTVVVNGREQEIFLSTDKELKFKI